jgi:hypothetical protein
MRLFVRKGSSVVPVFVCATQTFVETEDFIQAMLKYAKPFGAIDNIYVDFENTKVPVSDVSEIRVLAQMTAAYYNASLAQNLAADKDLYGMSYTPEAWPHTNTEECDIPMPLPSSVTERAKNVKCSVPNSWDDELHSDQVVFDPTFEINEDLVPWVVQPDKWEDKYGFY